MARLMELPGKFLEKIFSARCVLYGSPEPMPGGSLGEAKENQAISVGE